MHVHAVARATDSYEHITPESVGNERRILVSELSGRSNIAALTSKHNLQNDRHLMDRILAQVVKLENEGYQFEAAEASFDLLVRRESGNFHPHFEHSNITSPSKARSHRIHHPHRSPLTTHRLYPAAHRSHHQTPRQR